MVKVNGSTDRIFEAPFPATGANQARVSVSNAAQYMLEDFGRDIGLPSLGFDENNECWIKLDDKHLLCIAASPEHETVRLHGHVKTIQFDDEKSALTLYLRQLLEKNAEVAMNGGASFAIDPERSALTIVKSVPQRLTQQQMQDSIMDILKSMEEFGEFPSSERNLDGFKTKPPVDPVNSDEILLRA